MISRTIIPHSSNSNSNWTFIALNLGKTQTQRGNKQILGTELRGKNVVASRASNFKNVLAITKIHWLSITHRNVFVDVICLQEQKQLLFSERKLFLHFCK